MVKAAGPQTQVVFLRMFWVDAKVFSVINVQGCSLTSLCLFLLVHPLIDCKTLGETHKELCFAPVYLSCLNRPATHAINQY